MTDLVPFDYSGHQIRTILIDGEPWFVAADICAVLEIAEPHRSLASLDEDEKGRHTVTTPGGPQAMTVVSEAGLYSLILRSRKAAAKAFKRWITHEVLPSIRRTGEYSVAREIPKSFAEALELAARQAREIEAAKSQVAVLEPAAHSWETLADSTGDYSLRDAAQILDRDPAIETGQNRLMKYLREIRWVDGRGTPYQREVDNGRLAVRVLPYSHPHTQEPKLSSQIRVTAKGLHELHKRLGGERPLRLVVSAAAS